MIRLLVIVPYPELKDRVEHVIATHPQRAELKSDIRVLTVDRLQRIDPALFDVIIARGYSARKLREEYPMLPVVDLTISGSDIIRTVIECRNVLGVSKIAILGFYQKIYEAHGLCRLLGYDVDVYPAENTVELEQNIFHAKASGYDAVIGGYSAVELAQKYGIPCRLIKSGEDTIFHALNEAILMVTEIRRERVRANTYKTIIYASKDGILYVDSQGIIRLRNHVVRRMNGDISLLETKLSKTLPFLCRTYQDTLANGTEHIGEVHTISKTGMTVSVSFVPVVTNNSVEGVVITLSDITHLRELESRLKKSLVEKGLRARFTFRDILHESPEIDRTIEIAKKYAATNANIIISGETGTGKELFAQSIHNESSRKDGPFVAINCAALPESLLESELFGYVEGAFTGTTKGGKMGLFEQANGGTLFLDEVTEISPSTQSKLLRVLQEGEVRRIGDNRVIAIDVRILAATNKSMGQLAEQGLFRRDLMYRLDVLRLFVPPLRERSGDARLLFLEFLKKRFAANKAPVPQVTEDALALLSDYRFSGNVRELMNITERTAALCDHGLITKDDILSALYPPSMDGEEKEPVKQPAPQEEVPVPNAKLSSERDLIMKALSKSGGNRSKAASSLGIDRSTLWRRMKRLGIA